MNTPVSKEKAVRIVVKRDKQRRCFVVVAPPFPKIGDVCTIKGEDWEVVTRKETGALFSVSFPKAKTRQVFP